MRFEDHNAAFREADRRYAELKRQHDAGVITEQEFDAMRKELMVRDGQGRWWAKSRRTGEWHYHDGSGWVNAILPYELSKPSGQPESSIHKPTIEDFLLVFAKYKGSRYYVGDAIPRNVIANARASFLIPAGERVAALVDTSTALTKGLGLAVCEEGIRWRSDTSASTVWHGFLTWRDLAGVVVSFESRRGGPSWNRITMGEDNTFFVGESTLADSVARLLIRIQGLLTSAPTE